MNQKRNLSLSESITYANYFRDYYKKDFQYISPDMLKANQVNHHGYERNCTGVVNMWMKEVTAGVKQFFYGGTLHGVKYIFEPTFSRKERATWIVIVVVSIAFCAANIIKLFSKWTSTPFVNVMDSLPTPIWAVPFPTVVLCPHLHVKLSYANVLKLGRDLVKSCNWPAKHDTRWVTSECCEKYFMPIFTDYGLCYAFNSLPLNGMRNDTISWQRSFNRHAAPSSLLWGLDVGYPKVFPPDPSMQPLRVMVSGEDYGLGVELYLNISEHQHACDGNSLGFTVLIRSPTNHVYTSTVLRLPMDRMTTIEVSPITYKTDSALRSLAPDQRQCFFQNERKLEYYEFYTGSNCKHDIFVRESKRLCNCTLYNWPRKNASEPVCSTTKDFECIDDVKGKVEEQQIYAYYAECEEGKGSGEPASCHPSCNDVIYDSQVYYSDLIKEPGDPSPVWGRPKKGELTQINVHFYEDMFLGQHRHAQYDDYYFAGI
ncbi:pickpocket protein 28-like [Ostrinia nubilalis]|uniref:pickpocket protein 28-like n=1 Tax=Ostrinia nubilalis TaxID=29057 RepID=UPI003082380E